MSAAPRSASAGPFAVRVHTLADTGYLVEVGTIPGDDDVLVPPRDTASTLLANVPPAMIANAAAGVHGPVGFTPLRPGPEATAAVVGLTDLLRELVLPGVIDLIPAYATLLILIDPDRVDRDGIQRLIPSLAREGGLVVTTPGRLVTLPVAYGGEFGPDLADVAQHTGLSTELIAARHAAGGGEPYLVAFVGFSPGFGYLLGLPDELQTPRLASPRTRVPVGSVAIGGAQTGVYSLPTPGGWRLIGRTPVPLFDATAAEPGLLRPGDRVRFQPIYPDSYQAIERAVAAGEYVVDTAPWPPGSPTIASHKPREIESPQPPTVSVGKPSTGLGNIGQPNLRLIIHEAGLLTTIQDRGRPRYGHSGISPGGAVDRRSLRLGNQLVANPPDAAALEITLLGPRLSVTEPIVAVLGGADLGATVAGQPVDCWRPFHWRPDQELTFTSANPDACGVRTYLCVAGGIVTPPVLGSRALDISSGLGGLDGRPLRAGDELPLGHAALPDDDILRRHLAISPPNMPRRARARVTLGPNVDRFTGDAFELLINETFRVSARSDRLGIRLEGRSLPFAITADMVSEGVAQGSVQVPGDGQPIILLAGRQTVGGYAKIATVIDADLDQLAQLRPGDELRFEPVSPSEAFTIGELARRTLSDAVTIDGSANAAAKETAPARSLKADQTLNGARLGVTAMDWNPDGVARVIAAARDARVSRLRLAVASAGLDIELEFDDAALPFERGSPGREVAASNDQSPEPIADAPSDAPDALSAPDVTTITAPVVGTFYRQPSPNETPFVDLGGAVIRGQVVGLIEVMKTFYELTAPMDGVVTEIHIDDSTPVEYGQPVMVLSSAPELG